MKNFMLATVLLFNGVFVATAQAQHGHGGHGGGHGHGGHSYGGHGYGFGPGYGGHGIGHSIYHGHGGYYYPGYYYPSDYYYAYYAPNYYSYPPTTYIYPRPTSAYPPTSMPSAPKALAANQAKIQVVLPDPEAQVLFDGVKTSSLGRIRFFDPPALESGYTYTYKISASWTQGGAPMSDVRVVTVATGRVTLVDFSQPVTEAVPPPSKQKSSP